MPQSRPVEWLRPHPATEAQWFVRKYIQAFPSYPAIKSLVDF